MSTAKSKSASWSVRQGRSTSTYREENHANLYVSRVPGAIKHRVALAWSWRVSKADRFFSTAMAERCGRCATEAEAQAAADAALPSVLKAYDALEVPYVGGH